MLFGAQKWKVLSRSDNGSIRGVSSPIMQHPPSQAFDPETRSRHRGPAWNPFDPNVLTVVDPNSELGRDLAISLQATAEEEAEESGNTISLTDE
jgi:hypothetical protein